MPKLIEHVQDAIELERNLEVQQAIGVQEIVDPTDSRNRVREVLEDVARVDRVEPLDVQLRGVQCAVQYVEASFLAAATGMLGVLDAQRVQPLSLRCREEFAGGGPYVENAGPPPLATQPRGRVLEAGPLFRNLRVVRVAPIRILEIQAAVECRELLLRWHGR